VKSSRSAIANNKRNFESKFVANT